MSSRLSIPVALLPVVLALLQHTILRALAPEHAVSAWLWLAAYGPPALGLLALWRGRARLGLVVLAVGLVPPLVLAWQGRAWALFGVALLGLGAVMLAARRLLLPRGRRVVLIDGTCVACHRIVAELLRRDRAGVYHFAHVQSPYGRAVLARHGRKTDAIDGVYLLTAPGTPEEELLIDGAAGRLLWPSVLWVATPLLLLPRAWLDPPYRFFARHRYRWFGQYAQCYVPNAAERARFISDAESAAE